MTVGEHSGFLFYNPTVWCFKGLWTVTFFLTAARPNNPKWVMDTTVDGLWTQLWTQYYTKSKSSRSCGLPWLSVLQPNSLKICTEINWNYYCPRFWVSNVVGNELLCHSLTSYMQPNRPKWGNGSWLSKTCNWIIQTVWLTDPLINNLHPTVCWENTS